MYKIQTGSGNLKSVNSEACVTKDFSKKKIAFSILRNSLYIMMFLMCFAVFWTGWSWTAVGMAVVLYFTRMFAITGFYHRYFSHKTFNTSRFFQWVMCFWGMTSVQRGPLWWSAHHRHHHKHSDTSKDVHSPHQHSFLWAHMLWIITSENFKTKTRLIPDLVKFRELRIMEKLDYLPPALLAVSLYLLGVLLEKFYPALGTSGFQLLVWGFFISTAILYNGTYSINTFTHMMGKKRYHTKDKSGNSLILALVTLGEGWHNNHHYYQSSTRQGFFWWEIDITFYGLKVLNFLGLIHNLKPVPVRIRSANLIKPGK